jgi:hypothetical protein
MGMRALSCSTLSTQFPIWLDFLAYFFPASPLKNIFFAEFIIMLLFFLGSPFFERRGRQGRQRSLAE